LLRNPQILIFDEATSALDSLVEKEIADTIKDISHSRPDLMTVIVAHRLSTVMHANNIYVLEH
jgi:ATP-binding cassette, subfamily B, bacterial